MKQRSRGPPNELHNAALAGSMEGTLAVLSRGTIDIDEGGPEGSTALMAASFKGFAQIVSILLQRGANVSMVNDHGDAALHMAAQRGHVPVAKMLVKAGADVESATPPSSFTPLHQAAKYGHSGVVTMLLKAGANPDRRAVNGVTPLYMMATVGSIGGVKALLRAGADPLLAVTNVEKGITYVPLDAAAAAGHSEIACELMQQFGIEGCGGISGGTGALQLAASYPAIAIMRMLTSAGVADTGFALLNAAKRGHYGAAKFLLQQGEGRSRPGYMEIRDLVGNTPLVCAIASGKFASSAVVQLLVEHGADTTSAVRLIDWRHETGFRGDPLAFTIRALRQKRVEGKEATEDQLHSLEATRRLLLRVEAVQAASWLWPGFVPPVVRRQSAAEGASRTKNNSIPLVLTLPILRRRARRHGVALAPLFRCG